MSTPLDILQGYGQGATLGTLPYLQAGVQYAMQPSSIRPMSYSDYVAQNQAYDAAARSNSPGSYMAANLVGGMVPATFGIGAARAIAPGLSPLRQALMANTAQGAVQGMAAPVSANLSTPDSVKARLEHAAEIATLSGLLTGGIHGVQQTYAHNSLGSLADAANLSAKTAQTSLNIANDARNSLHNSIARAMKGGQYSQENLDNVGGGTGIPTDFIAPSNRPILNEIQSAINANAIPDYRTASNFQNIGGLSDKASNFYNQALDNQIANRITQVATDNPYEVVDPSKIKSSRFAPLITLGDIQHKLLSVATKNPNAAVGDRYIIPDAIASGIQDSANSLLSGAPDTYGYSLTAARSKGLPFIYNSGIPAGSVSPTNMMNDLSGAGSNYVIPGSIGSNITQVPISAVSNFAGQRLGNLLGQ